MGIIAGTILIGVIIYTVITLHRQKNRAEADRRRKKFKGREVNDPQKSRVSEAPHEEEEEQDSGR